MSDFQRFFYFRKRRKKNVKNVKNVTRIKNVKKRFLHLCRTRRLREVLGEEVCVGVGVGPVEFSFYKQ